MQEDLVPCHGCRGCALACACSAATCFLALSSSEADSEAGADAAAAPRRPPAMVDSMLLLLLEGLGGSAGGKRERDGCYHCCDRGNQSVGAAPKGSFSRPVALAVLTSHTHSTHPTPAPPSPLRLCSGISGGVPCGSAWVDARGTTAASGGGAGTRTPWLLSRPSSLSMWRSFWSIIDRARHLHLHIMKHISCTSK